MRNATVLLLAAVFAMTAALAAGAESKAEPSTVSTMAKKSPSASTKAKRRAVLARKVRQARRLRLRQLSRCEGFERYMRVHGQRQVGPWGVGDGAFRSEGSPPPVPLAPGAPADAAPEAQPAKTPGQDFSTTNNQEIDVDEADIVKTDGNTMFAVADNRLRSIDVRRGQPRLLDTLELGEGSSGAKMLISGTRILVLTSGRPEVIRPVEAAPRVQSSPIWDPRRYRPTTRITLVDAADPAALRVVETATVDGSWVAARLSGGFARLVLTTPTFGPVLAAPVPGADGTVDQTALDAAAARNEEILAGSTAADWLPRMSVQKGASGPAVRTNLVECDQVSIPRRHSGLDMTTVLTINPKKGAAPVDRDAVMTSADLVYASAKSLYIATPRWFSEVRRTPGFAPRGMTTTIHRFEIVGASTTYRAAGKVPGYLLSQFAMSEHKGVLRVASTTAPPWWGGRPAGQSESYVTILRERSGGLLKAGQVGGLGKDERIYAVRFLGDMGYVVTFRQVDPLYTVDLSRPSRPRVTGELKITGYSAYLHPVGKDLLLGVGQEATAQGRRQGAQVSLFDVSDPTRPKRRAKRLLGKSWSSVEWDHHAFLYWPKTGLTMLPITVETSDASQGSYGYTARAVGLRVSRSGIGAVGSVSHPTKQGGAEPILRSVVVGNTVYTLSAGGLAANALANLRPRTFLAFDD